MGYLVAWIAVVGSAAVLLVGWLFGPSLAALLPPVPVPGVAAVGVILALLLVDAGMALRARLRR